MQKYDFTAIEKKWRGIWESRNISVKDEKKPNYYCLDMFPYPSGAGLHVGHWRGYVLSDIWSRYKMLQGFNVLHPMGWDAFGLPAENHAIKMRAHPRDNTAANIANMKRQLKEISAVYDWDREIDTTDPGYYKWTQWIFVKMMERGLAYEKEMPLNWCPKCKTVLANEEAAGGVCDRCKTPVTKKMLRQWMLKITDYAERLLNDLDGLEWSPKVKKMQADWIGKSSGADVDFLIAGSDVKLSIYTTRPDTLFGATFMVLAPEHPLVSELTKPEQAAEMDAYLRRASARSSVDRLADKEKTGVFTGSYAINPMTGSAAMPVWVSDYVLADYGTGAIMCVPAHDERDYEFALQFNLPVVQVIADTQSETVLPYVGDGVLVNSAEFSGMPVNEAQPKITAFLEQQGVGKGAVRYKLRDWVFSRQRYWGEPIPVVHCPACGSVPVPENQLPVLLPDVANFLPTDTGESPLAGMPDWVSTVCPVCGAAAKRETNTMPQWAGSSWYFLRYADPHNTKALASPEALKKWLPVDYYVGGVEHAVLHLLYARFYTKFLYDIGVLDFDEPFKKLFNQGMICRFGKKMDKSGDNAVSPDETVKRYGCDALRLYELFAGPPEADSEWDDSGIEGVFRFLNRLWKLVYEYKSKPAADNAEWSRLRSKLAADVTTRLENLSLNTVVSAFMENFNSLAELAKKYNGAEIQCIKNFAVLLAPFAPHLAEEIWESAGGAGSVFGQKWPEYNAELLKTADIVIALQVNGKLRGQLTVPADIDGKDAVQAAKEFLGDRLNSGGIIKEVYVPGKIINFVVKG
ncbi:MAG: leucine--tRNA ligase [Defluviitaleaceae bacterium]|nr:leucine--tRNA ligase [Defluviitaleaceae bacterium]